MTSQTAATPSRKWTIISHASILILALTAIAAHLHLFGEGERQHRAAVRAAITEQCAARGLTTGLVGESLVCADLDGRLFAIPKAN
jgi:hypothetical protein